MLKQNFKLVHPLARQRAIQAVQDAPEGWVVTVSEPTRSLDANAKLHAILQELDGKEWFGKPRTALEWKVLLVSGHSIATGRTAEIVPGIEGELVNIRESTAHMTVGRLSSLIEYITAWRAQHE